MTSKEYFYGAFLSFCIIAWKKKILFHRRKSCVWNVGFWSNYSIWLNYLYHLLSETHLEISMTQIYAWSYNLTWHLRLSWEDGLIWWCKIITKPCMRITVFRGTYFTRISFPLSYSSIEYKRSDTIQTSSGLWRSFPADLTSKSATMCVLFAVYHQDIFLEPAEGVKRAVMQHKLQFLYCAIAFVKEKNSVWPCCQCFITEMTKKMWHSILLVYLHVCFTQLNKAFNFNTHINTKSFWDCIH